MVRSNFKDRIGEVKVNNQGTLMEIIEYRSTKDIDVLFVEYNWVSKHKRYSHFKDGSITCPYYPTVYNVGFTGEGKYKPMIDYKAYKTWCSMIERCYSEKYHEKFPTYKDCHVKDEWLNFQNFAEWFYENYYEIEGQRTCLDKDILVKGNKIYSPKTCIFAPERINSLFVKSNSKRGETPIGTDKLNNSKYEARCVILVNGKKHRHHIGNYSTEEEAFCAYKKFKEEYIKGVADEYKDLIPNKLYKAMMEYEVEIND